MSRVVVRALAWAKLAGTTGSGAAGGALVSAAEATHFLVIEEHRERLVREVQNILDEQ
jgi:hypothetical protein